jgi:hypothetical protein
MGAFDEQFRDCEYWSQLCRTEASRGGLETRGVELTSLEPSLEG